MLFVVLFALAAQESGLAGAASAAAPVVVFAKGEKGYIGMRIRELLPPLAFSNGW